MRDVLAVILGGGRGSRLYPLTKLRAKPAVPIAGRYRLIDIPISNCLNSDIHKIYVLTQFLSASLHRHIFQTYKFDLFSGGFVDILAAEETASGIGAQPYRTFEATPNTQHAALFISTHHPLGIRFRHDQVTIQRQ